VEQVHRSGGATHPGIGMERPAPIQYLAFVSPLFVLMQSTGLRLIGLVLIGVVLWQSRSHVRRDPVLFAFLLFSIAITLFFQYESKSLHEVTVPITGWAGGFNYMGFIFFAVVCLAFGLRGWGWAAIALLLFLAIMGSHEWLSRGAQGALEPVPANQPLAARVDHPHPGSVGGRPRHDASRGSGAGRRGADER
jgi:hypothetical protein